MSTSWKCHKNMQHNNIARSHKCYFGCSHTPGVETTIIFRVYLKNCRYIETKYCFCRTQYKWKPTDT